MKTKSLVFSFIISLITISSFAAKAETVTCELTHDAPIGAWRPSGRINYDQTIVKQIDLPIEASAQKQTEIIFEESLNKYFMRTLKVTGNLHLDPVTNKKKLFVGLYEVRTSSRFNDFSVFHMSHVSGISKSYDGRPLEEGLTPVVSGVSDSGVVELLAEHYGSVGSPSKMKLRCSLEDVVKPVPALDFANKKENLTCDIFVGHYASNKAVKEHNKQVILGYNPNEFIRDLQPIIEDKHFNGFFANVNIMANIYMDKITNEPKILLGLYKVRRAYDPEKHGEYWIPENYSRGRDGTPFFFAYPHAEVISSSDYAELYTAAAFEGFAIKLSCKRLNNQNQWTESYTY